MRKIGTSLVIFSIAIVQKNVLTLLNTKIAIPPRFWNQKKNVFLKSYLSTWNSRRAKCRIEADDESCRRPYCLWK